MLVRVVLVRLKFYFYFLLLGGNLFLFDVDVSILFLDFDLGVRFFRVRLGRVLPSVFFLRLQVSSKFLILLILLAA